MKKVIHIYGAAGSGASTAGAALCEKYGYRHIDSDDYLWLPTEPEFTQLRSADERVFLMQCAIESAENTVITGSVSGWGDALIPSFTLAVRLNTPTEIRIERLEKRELERFGDRIKEGGDMYSQHLAFIKWASEYDTGDEHTRSKKAHDLWQEKLRCKRITLDGTLPTETLVQIISGEFE